MISFVVASILFILICIISLVITYYVVVLLNENKTAPEPGLNAIISTNIMLLFSYITDLASDTLQLIISRVLSYVNFLTNNYWLVIRVLTLIGLILAINSDITGALSTIDSFFRCLLQPLVQNVIFAILHVVRILFDGVIPIYNYYYMIISQLFKGSATLAIKCDIKNVYETIKLVLQIFIAQFESVSDWSGVGNGMSAENNIFVNEFNITEIFNKTQHVIYHQKSVVSCACDGLADISELFFLLFNTPHPPRIINHLFNVFISVIQMFIQVIPPFSKELSLQKTVFHMNSAIFETGEYIDTVLIRWAETLIGFFDRNFQIQGAPKNFIGTSLARFGISIVNLIHTIIRSIVGIIVPVKHLYQDSHYMLELTKIDHAIIQVRLGIEHLTTCLYWFGTIIELFISDSVINNIGRGVDGQQAKIPSIPPFVELDCYQKPFVNEQARTIACIVQLIPLTLLNVVHLVYALFWELIWKSLIFQEQSVLRTIQRYDGLSYPKTTPITCEVRKQAKKDGWDLTNKECLCEKEYNFGAYEVTSLYPFGKQTYDPYCGQPNLQADVFGVMERLVSYTGNFVGIKYVFAAVENFFLIALEFVKIGIKVLLNFYDIGRGTYFQYPINCGYGVSELALEEWWVSEGKPFNSEYCKTASVGNGNWEKVIGPNFNNYIGIEVGNNKNFHRYIDPVFVDNLSGDGHFKSYQYAWSGSHTIVTDGVSRNANIVCYPKHELLRFYRCIRTKYNGEAYCSENKNGCTCNTLIDLEPKSHCQCVYNFPDTEQEAAQGSFRNPLTESMQENYFHLCNTYFAEHVFYYFEKIGLYFDELITDFHPGYDVKTGRAVYKTRTDSFGNTTTFLSHYEYDSYCQTAVSNFEVYKTTIIEENVLFLERQNMMQLFNSVLANQGKSYATEKAYGQYCRTFGSKDFMCSITLSMTHIIKLLSNEVRVVLVSIFNFIGDPSLVRWRADFSERLCDLQRSLAGVASIVSSLISGIIEGVTQSTGVTLHKSLAKVLFAVLNFFVHALQMFNLVLNWINMVMSGKVDFGPAVFKLIVDQIVNWIDWSVQLMDALDYLVKDIIAKSGGDAGVTLFESFKIILELVRGLLKGVVLKLAILVGKLFFNFMACFGGQGCGDFLATFMEMFDLVIDWLVTDGLKMIEELIFKALGPIGDIIRTIATSLCGVLNDVFKFIGVKERLDCPDSSRRRLLSEFPAAYSDLPFQAANMLTWDGVSECDLNINAYKTYQWEDLRPIEKNLIYGCLEQRLLAHALGKMFQLPIPYDLMYNWQRKYYMMYDFGRATILFVQHKMGHITTSIMMKQFKDKKLDIDLWLPIFYSASSNLYRLSSLTNIDQSIEWFLTNAATKPESVFHDIKYLYNASKVVIKQVAKCAQETYTDVPKIYNALVKLSPEIDIPSRVLQSYRKGFLYPPATTPSQLNARRFVLKAAGAISDTTPCNEREDSYVCTNCNILDNFLTVVIKEGQALSDYYTYTYSGVVIPGFVRWAQEEDEEGRAWRQDFAEMMAKAAKQAADKVQANFEEFDSQLEEDFNSGKIRLQRSFVNYTNTSNYVYLTNFERAKKDWDYLFANFDVRNKNYTFWQIVDDLFIKTTDEYVPFFAYSIPYYVSYPFTEACPVEIIYCSTRTTSDRLKRIPSAFIYYISFVLAVYLLDMYTSLPIYSIFSMWQMYILAFVFLFYVYGWTFLCFPNFPNCFADDLLAFTNDYLFPDCFCSYYDGLSKACNPETCFLCSKQTSFYECEAEIPLLKTHGLYWAPLFLFRYYFPDTMVFLLKTIPFSWIVRESPLFVELADNVLGKIEPTALELDCMGLKYLDIFMVATLFIGGSYFLSTGASLVIRYTQHFLKIFPMFLLTITNMATSIELQSIAGLTDDI